MNIQLNEACIEQHKAVTKKGFVSCMEQLPRLLMLTVSELGEALEADRKDRRANIEAFQKALPTRYATKDYSFHRIDPDMTPEEIEERYKKDFEKYMKDTLEDELADAFLRLMDICGIEGIDIETHILAKAAYNELRPAKHGKKY